MTGNSQGIATLLDKRAQTLLYSEKSKGKEVIESE